MFESQKKTTNSEVLKILKEGAALAIQDAKKLYNYKLDYSDDSIKNIDSILSRLRNEYSNTNNNSVVESFALVFGLYVIEVFERNHGHGYLQRRQTGQDVDSFPYFRKGKLIFPCTWCLNKLFDKNAEDIWVKYNSFI